MSDFSTRHPYHFRATRYGISLLTTTIYGSTFSIPEPFLQTSLYLKEATTVNPGVRLKVEVTSRLPLHGNHPSGVDGNGR